MPEQKTSVDTFDKYWPAIHQHFETQHALFELSPESQLNTAHTRPKHVQNGCGMQWDKQCSARIGGGTAGTNRFEAGIVKVLIM